MSAHPSCDLMHLSDAATLAYRRLFWRLGQPTDETREAIALALSSRLQIFGVRYPGAGPTMLTRIDYSTGRFIMGATRFELPDGSVMRLTVRKADFMRLIDWLATLALFRTCPAF